jgi:hypothetical protein
VKLVAEDAVAVAVAIAVLLLDTRDFLALLTTKF